MYVLVKYTKTYFDLENCCFEPGTQVLVSLDGQTKSIEDIKAGDTVVSYDVNTDSNYLAEVIKLIVNKKSIDMARVEFENGTVLRMTDYHPLYTKEGWSSISDKNYRQLKIGDEVKTENDWSKVTRIILYQNSDFMTTYTLAIKNYGENPDIDINDNFYANGILAHNGTHTCSEE